MPPEPNPYASPVEVARDDRPPSFGDAVLLRRGFLFRRVRLPAPFGAVLEYSGRRLGRDVVRVSSRVVARRWAWLWFVPRFDFSLAADGRETPAVLSVEVDLLLRIKRMAIEIDDRLVYEEQN